MWCIRTVCRRCDKCGVDAVRSARMGLRQRPNQACRDGARSSSRSVTNRNVRLRLVTRDVIEDRYVARRLDV